MSENEQTIEKWVKQRRAAASPDEDAFTRAVMTKIKSSPPAKPHPPVLPLLPVLPRPVMASLCLAAGTGKVLLVLHLAFS